MARTTVRPLRREQILDVASRLMTERGWSGLTFAAVCQEAGISNGVLTYHFRDKDDLLFALYLRETDRLRKLTSEAFIHSDAPLRERLTELLSMKPNEGVERRELRMLTHHFLGLAIDRNDIAEKFKEIYEQRVADFVSRLAKDADEGVITRDPRRGAEIMVLSMAGFGILNKMFCADLPREEIVELLYGYLTGAASPVVAAGVSATTHGP